MVEVMATVGAGEVDRVVDVWKEVRRRGNFCGGLQVEKVIEKNRGGVRLVEEEVDEGGVWIVAPCMK